MRVPHNIWIALLPCLVVALNLNAAPVDLEMAQSTANSFMLSRLSQRVNAHGTPSLCLAHAERSLVSPASADYYVFNADDGSAFVIIAGDDRATDVLAYGEGTLDVSDLPCNLQWMLGSYREQMEYLHAHPSERVQSAAPYNDVTIPPMVTSNWNQRAPYNNRCPEVDGERSVTGCIATAMAQVMYYWRYPERAPSLNGYTTDSHHIWMHPLPSTSLDWDQMLDVYASGAYTDEQGDAVAVLMLYCGQSSQMDYSPDGSGTYVRNQLQGMRAFGYSNDMSMLNKSNYDIEDWDAMMLDDLKWGRPILYSGADGLAGGHAFVLDGYYEGKYHINWGWGGTGDGYFALDAFNVRGYAFNTQQQMLHRVHPPTAEAEDGYDFEQGGIYYMYNWDATGLLVTYKDTRYACYAGEVTIPAQVTHAGETLPVVGIGKSAFRGSTTLTRVTIPPTVKTIEDYAFNGCVDLQEVEIPQGVTTIGSKSFAYCYHMTRVLLPAGLKSIKGGAFTDCNSLERVEPASLDSWLDITFSDELSNPLSCAHHLYIDGNEVTELHLSASQVDAVGPYAFAGCTGLTRVHLDGVPTVDRAAFKGCSAITQLTLAEGLETMGSEALAGCTSLTAVEIPSTMSRLENSLFASCSGLKSVTIPASVESIGNGTFNGCTSLAQVTLPERLTAIGSNAFNGCTSLQTLPLPAALVSIGASAFAGCTRLETVVLPPALTSMGEQAYEGCSSLRTLALTGTLSKIPGQAFAQCSALTAVTIPDGIVEVGVNAFYKCIYLNTITMGKDVALLESGAFDNNPRVKTIICRAMTPPLMEHTNTYMRSVYKNATLYVPAASVDAYKHTGIWSWFLNIAGLPDPTSGDVNGDGEVNIADVNTLVAAIIQGRPSARDMDVNGDGEVNISDVNALIDYIRSN